MPWKQSEFIYIFRHCDDVCLMGGCLLIRICLYLWDTAPPLGLKHMLWINCWWRCSLPSKSINLPLFLATRSLFSRVPLESPWPSSFGFFLMCFSSIARIDIHGVIIAKSSTVFQGGVRIGFNHRGQILFRNPSLIRVGIKVVIHKLTGTVYNQLGTTSSQWTDGIQPWKFLFVTGGYGPFMPATILYFPGE